MGKSYWQAMGLLHRTWDKSPYPIGYRQEKEDIEQGIFDNYHVFYQMLDTRPKKIAYTVRETGIICVLIIKEAGKVLEKHIPECCIMRRNINWY